MMKTFDDIKTDILVKLNASTSQAFYTDTILGDWIQQGEQWANSFKKWPFTEGRVSTTYSSSTEEYSYPEGWRSDSIRMLRLGGKRVQKLNFEDYQIFREEKESSTDRVFSDFTRTYFINPNIDLSGTITVYGQYTPVPIDITDLTAETVFSNHAEEGNEAIVEKVLSFAKTREKKLSEAGAHEEKAKRILNELWQKIADEQFAYHTKDRGMWERFDVLEGDYFDEVVKRNRWF